MADDNRLPNIMVQGKNYAIAYSKWTLAGQPLRSDAKIAQLFDECCSKCPDDRFVKVSDTSGRCKDCGCWVKRHGTKKNKLAWPTERCPYGHFTNEVLPDFMEQTQDRVDEDPEVTLDDSSSSR